jgi:hypothetical protein
MAVPGGATHSQHAGKHGVPEHHSSNNSCTCLGACCAAPTVAVPGASVAELPVPIVTFDAARPMFAAAVRPVAVARYAHPFANGPPAPATIA